MNTPDDGRLQRARALFDAQVDALDGATATALRARRREAIATMPTRHRRAWWWPASGIATAALALVLWLPRTDGPMPDGALAPMASVADDPRLPISEPASSPMTSRRDDPATEAARFADTALVELEDDPEFYAWLATVPDDALDTDNTALPEQGPQEGWTL